MPFYRFNGFTGRLQPSAEFQPFYPISPKPLEKIQEPAMIFDSVKTKPVSTSPGQVRNASGLNPQLAKNIERFNAVRHLPVYRAGGTTDRILFGFTCVLTAVCMSQAGVFLYSKMQTK